MGIRELIADIKENPSKYFQERNPAFAEGFFHWYCAAKCDWSDDRPEMFVKDMRVDLFYYQLLGHCLAHHEEGIPEEEIDATFCQEFGDWLIPWIRENVDEDYTSQSRHWYEDIQRILPEGKEEIYYFLELCELFFEDYGARKGFDPYEIPDSYGNHKFMTLSKVDVIPSWRPRGPMKSVILITASETFSENTYRQWKREGENIGCDSGDLAMELRGEMIYVWLEGDRLAGYDDSKLQQLNIPHPYFYNIRYSDQEVMKYFVEKTRFPRDSYMDNGENILSLQKIKKDMEAFIE